MGNKKIQAQLEKQADTIAVFDSRIGRLQTGAATLGHKSKTDMQLILRHLVKKVDDLYFAVDGQLGDEPEERSERMILVLQAEIKLIDQILKELELILNREKAAE